MIGKTFRYGHADANPEWRVMSARGKGVYVCRIINCPDYEGHEQLFSTEQIKALEGFERAMQQRFARSEDFYARLNPGQIIHYCNGHKQWVRLKAERQNGQMVVIPIALVGEWREYDLPHRNRTGELTEGYHAKQIREGKPFHTPASNIYECPERPRSHNQHGNPNDMPAINLNVLPPTPAEIAITALWRKLRDVESVLNDHKENDPNKLLSQIRAIVQ